MEPSNPRTRRISSKNGEVPLLRTNKQTSGPKQPVTRQVADTLFQMLRSGEYRIGDQLPSEWELVKTTGAGRSAVREGVRELVALGLVELRRGSGTYVRDLRPDLLLGPDSFRGMVQSAVRGELLEVRRIIEPEAAALAATRASAGDLQHLEHDVMRLREAVDVGYMPPEDLGFHMNVVRAAHNTALDRVAGSIVSYYKWNQTLPTERDIEDHAAILGAIKQGDADETRRLMANHLAAESPGSDFPFHHDASRPRGRRGRRVSS